MRISNSSLFSAGRLLRSAVSHGSGDGVRTQMDGISVDIGLKLDTPGFSYYFDYVLGSLRLSKRLFSLFFFEGGRFSKR